MEDQQYMEKLKQLSKYIEPLRRMINKIDKNEGEVGARPKTGSCPEGQSSVLLLLSDRKKDLSKMKSLLNILTDPNIR